MTAPISNHLCSPIMAPMCFVMLALISLMLNVNVIRVPDTQTICLVGLHAEHCDHVFYLSQAYKP